MKRYILFLGALTLFSAGTVFGAPPVCDAAHPLNNFCLTGAGSNIVLDGVYISPYSATVNGVPSLVICDDFLHDVQVPESWRATQSSIGSSVIGTFGEALNSSRYAQLGWLAEQLYLQPSANAGAISYAIWAVFNSAAVNTWLSGDAVTSNAVTVLLAQSLTHVSENFSNVDVYTPENPAFETCATCGKPQEFLVVRTPEASSTVLLGINFLGFGAFAFLMRRKLAGVR